MKHKQHDVSIYEDMSYIKGSGKLIQLTKNNNVYAAIATPEKAYCAIYTQSQRWKIDMQYDD